MTYWNGTHWEQPDAAPHKPRPSRLRHAAAAVAEGSLIALLAVGLLAGTAFAGKGGGSLQASISLGETARTASIAGHVSVSVTRSIPDNDPVMWVTTKCYDESGKRVSWLDLPVVWGASDSLSGSAGAYPVSGSWCETYATLRPWQSRVLGDAYLRFEVGG
jgi:hypothetical protein